ncbi:hypothetical protein [Klebsiella pneumoniae]|uniref:hypothetical protein n=1 Tax=Klebsiella pneumoniae TaxID=573 RepID=UPI001E49BB44|nr:hypothetical protein [Klebsiella pneumoniae]MCC4986503.1 hypothetical protein [Klebsiella pneumoniae]
MKKIDKHIRNDIIANMSFYAQTDGELDEHLRKLDINVPNRGCGRLTEHSESWQIHKLLIALKSKGIIKLPLELTKRERPDFIIKSGDKVLGVELIEAINFDYVRINTLPEAQSGKSVIDASYFKWGNAERSLDELRSIAKKDKLTGPAWHGDSIEQEFSLSIYDCVKRKHNLLTSGYERFNENCLFIYHNNPSPSLDFNLAISFTEDRLKAYWSKNGFSIVFILKYNSFISLSKHGSEIIKIPH